MRSRCIAAFTAALFLLPALVQAQDVDTILANHLEARGGAEGLASIETLRMQGSSAAMGMEMGVDIRHKTPNMFLQVIQVMGQEIRQGTDGTTAWMLNPMAGPDPMVAPDEAADMMSAQADFTGALVNSAEKGYAITYEGMEMVDSMETYKLNVSHETLPSAVYYLDAATHMIVRSTSDGVNPATGAPGTIETEFADYRSVGATMFPHSIIMTIDGEPFQTITMTSITVNETMSNDLFAMPSPMGLDK